MDQTVQQAVDLLKEINEKDKLLPEILNDSSVTESTRDIIAQNFAKKLEEFNQLTKNFTFEQAEEFYNNAVKVSGFSEFMSSLETNLKQLSSKVYVSETEKPMDAVKKYIAIVNNVVPQKLKDLYNDLVKPGNQQQTPPAPVPPSGGGGGAPPSGGGTSPSGGGAAAAGGGAALVGGGGAPGGGTKQGPANTEEAVFDKFMVGPYDPNSPMDRGKMQVVKNMLKAYESKYGKPFNMSDASALAGMAPIAKVAYDSVPYKQAAGLDKKGPIKPSLFKTREGGILGIGAKDVYSPKPPPIGTKKYEMIDPKTGEVTQVRRATPVNSINIPKPGEVRREEDGSIRRKSKLSGAAGSISNFFGDVGNTLKK